MAHMVVQRVFGRTPDTDIIDKFVDWFTDNIDKMEYALNEVNPQNGQMTLDFQPKTRSFIVEVQTCMEDFANECLAKINELGFADSAKIGDVRKIKEEK
jgi:hypothetical protein